VPESLNYDQAFGIVWLIENQNGISLRQEIRRLFSRIHFQQLSVLIDRLDKASKRLPQEHGQPGDVLEMPVGSRQRQIGLQRDGSDPDVVLRDGTACLSQLRGDATVKLGRGFIG
jgi:hypothetical protein